MTMEKELIQSLIRSALAARKMAYVPYSHFQVGAALLCEDGTIYQGCNIENASLTPTNCAERTAFFKAVSEGKKAFRAICVVGGKEGAMALDICPPCGVCRQVIREFCSPESFDVILAASEDRYQVHKLKEILPYSFGPEFL